MGIKCFNIEKIEEEITYWENIKQIYYRTEIFPMMIFLHVLTSFIFDLVQLKPLQTNS